MNPTLPLFFWNEFRKRRKKSALITFALFWGTLSILLLMAFGQGMSTQFRTSFSGLGDTLIMITGGQTSLTYEGLPKGRQIRLYPEDIDDLRERIPEILRIVPESNVFLQVSAEGKEINRNVHGTTRFGLRSPGSAGAFSTPTTSPGDGRWPFSAGRPLRTSSETRIPSASRSSSTGSPSPSSGC